MVSPVKYRYYMNVCTVSYSMVGLLWMAARAGLDSNEWHQSATVFRRTGVRMVAAVPQSWFDRADL